MKRLLSALSVVAALVFGPAPARAADSGQVDVFARVTVTETEMRAGPGVSYRVIHRGHRGDAFLIQTRETSGYWLEVLLADGRTAYVLGDTVDVMGVDEGTPNAPSKPGIFAPPALEDAHGGLALMGGVWNGVGYSEARPAIVLAPAIAFEPYVGLALQSDSTRVLYGGAWALNLAPDWALAPFFVLGAGGMHETPKEENIRKATNWFTARVGGGLLVSLRLRLLLRLEFSDFVLYTEDRYKNVQSYVGGLGSYF